MSNGQSRVVVDSDSQLSWENAIQYSNLSVISNGRLSVATGTPISVNGNKHDLSIESNDHSSLSNDTSLPFEISLDLGANQAETIDESDFLTMKNEGTEDHEVEISITPEGDGEMSDIENRDIFITTSQDSFTSLVEDIGSYFDQNTLLNLDESDFYSNTDSLYPIVGFQEGDGLTGSAYIQESLEISPGEAIDIGLTIGTGDLLENEGVFGGDIRISVDKIEETTF